MMSLFPDLKNRETGISALGKVPWATPFCLFYENKEDLLDVLIPYFKAGFQSMIVL